MQTTLYELACPNGHPPFDVECTAEQFVEQIHRCPVCNAASRRTLFSAGVTSGTTVPGCRIDYPIRDFQLPVPNDGSYRAGQHTVVESFRDHKERAKRAGMEINQF